MRYQLTERIMSPPLEDIKHLQQQLTPGEEKVLFFLHKQLSLDWEIYVQPHLNGLCPDFVILNPKVGIVVIEVKDWNFSALNYRWSPGDGGTPPLLMGSKGGREFKVPNPFVKLDLYKSEIINLYCPSIGIRFTNAPVVTSVMVFATELTHAALKFANPWFKYIGISEKIQQTYYPVVGIDLLESGPISQFAPVFDYSYSKYMSEEYAAELRYWLHEPRAKQEQRTPIKLNRRQLELATSRTQTGYRRIRGAAGSGKSLVLATKAAKLALEGKQVLILSFNITLCNYLGDLAVRAALPQRGVRKSLTLLNYHQWAKRVCFLTGNKNSYDSLDWKGSLHQVLEETLPALVIEILESRKYPEFQYDVILVDEGQDFELSWWASVRHALHPEGEAVLVADRTQDLYETADAWTDDAMLGAGFSGAWAELRESYRLPADFIQLVRDFAQQFIQTEKRIEPENVPIQQELDTQTTRLKWIQTSPMDVISVCVDSVLAMPLRARNQDPLVYPDIVIMAENNKAGFEIVKRLGNKGIKVKHTFGHSGDGKDKELSRKQKMSFFIGSEQVKATTIHSFKGWESTCLLVHISKASSATDFAAIYTALTRLKASEYGYDSYLTVVCSAPELAEYGKTWSA